MQAILYAAKSTEDKRGSIPTQLEDGRRKAAEEDLAVVAEYADEAASAWSGDRGPQLAAALKHAGELGAALIVQHSDRLARGDGKQARHLAELYFEATRAGVTLRSVQDDSTFDSPILAAVMGERNAEDSRRKGLAVKAGMARRRESGRYIGHRPYGYRWERNEADERILVPDPVEAAIVRRIFDEYRAGRSQLAITRGLAAANVPTARGGKWHQGTVRTLLASPIYAGFIRDGEGVRPGIHEPIIDIDTWEETAVLREARARTSGRGRPPAGKHLFRKGMLRCECGEALVPRTSANGRQDPYEIYRCYGRHRDPNSCSMEPLQRAEIDGAVYSYFEQLGLDVNATRRQLAEVRGRKLSEVEALAGQAEVERHRAEERLSRVRRDYADGKLGAEDWAEFREELTAELSGAEAEVDRLASQLIEVETWGELGDTERDTLSKLADLRRVIAGEVQGAEGTEAVRAALARLFDRFVVRRAQPGQRIHADLAWAGDLVIEPIVAEQAVQGYSPLRPVFRREPLYDAGNNYVEGLIT